METTFAVYVEDNFHAMDESERFLQGTFNTYEEALQAAREIVDSFLKESHRSGMAAEDLYRVYTAFGYDPFIVPSNDDRRFSAWEYAKLKCTEICAG